MKIALTGGTGFIGSWVAKALSDDGHDVTIMARSPDRGRPLLALDNITIVLAPLEDPKAQAKALDGKDALIHLALGWGETPQTMLQNDTRASVRLFELAGEAGLKKVIYTSSTAASGYRHSVIDEKKQLLPSDLYGASKGASELYLRACRSLYPHTIYDIIRPGYIFANPVLPGMPTQRDQRFHTICKQAATGKAIDVTQDDGTQFLHAGDIAKVYASLVKENGDGQTLYCLGNRFLTWEQIARWAIDLAGSQSELVIKPKIEKSEHVMFSVEKIKHVFGYSFMPDDPIKDHLRYLLFEAKR